MLHENRGRLKQEVRCLWTRRRNDRGTGRAGGCQLHLALGSGVRARIGQALPPAPETDQQKLRTDETYIKVKGQDRYLYRAVDSRPDHRLSADCQKGCGAAQRFFRRALSSAGNPVPRIINVDKNRAFPAAVDSLKAEGTLPGRVYANASTSIM